MNQPEPYIRDIIETVRMYITYLAIENPSLWKSSDNQNNPIRFSHVEIVIPRLLERTKKKRALFLSIARALHYRGRTDEEDNEGIALSSRRREIV